MGVIVFFVDVYHKLFWNVVDWFRERYDGDLILFNQVEVPCLNKKKLKFHLTLGDNFECFREVLESLTLFCSFFNSLIWAELKSTHFQYSVSVDYKSYNVILMPRHEICGATDNIFCQFIMKRHGMEVDVVSSRGNWWSTGMIYRYFRGCWQSGKAVPFMCSRVVLHVPRFHPYLFLLIYCNKIEA